jgi:hypothetical protein
MRRKSHPIDRQSLLKDCASIRFGRIRLNGSRAAFYRLLNHQVLDLCRRLPPSVQTEALIHFMYSTDTSLTDGLEVFKHYPAPVWSILFHLGESRGPGRRPEETDLRHAGTAHAMAMILHSIDDHLNDGEAPATHLMLLIRSEAWSTLNRALNYFAEDRRADGRLAERLIDEYYTAVCRPPAVASLTGYCRLAWRQAATGLIAPLLLARRRSSDKAFLGDIEIAQSAMIAAWRLLDDIQDLAVDLHTGAHSAVYFCLTPWGKSLWGQGAAGEEDSPRHPNPSLVLDHLAAADTIAILVDRICRELESAAAAAERCRLPGLAAEYSTLMRPLTQYRNERSLTRE